RQGATDGDPTEDGVRRAADAEALDRYVREAPLIEPRHEVRHGASAPRRRRRRAWGVRGAVSTTHACHRAVPRTSRLTGTGRTCPPARRATTLGTPRYTRSRTRPSFQRTPASSVDEGAPWTRRPHRSAFGVTTTSALRARAAIATTCASHASGRS